MEGGLTNPPALTGTGAAKGVTSVEALGGASGISKSEVSRICQGLDEQVKAFLGRTLDHARFPYVYLDATYLHGRLGRNMQVVSRAVVVAIGINALGYREVLGIAVGDSEAEGFWRQFLGSLKERGLTGTRLVISDAHLGLTAAIRRMFQGSSWQRCRVHYRPIRFCMHLLFHKISNLTLRAALILTRNRQNMVFKCVLRTQSLL